jgi:hypothetical protein
MLNALLLLSLAAAPSFVPGTYPERAAVWKRFTVKEIELGTELSKLKGFTCDAKPGSYRHTCVKFLDDRCKGRPSYAKSISFAADVPPGQGCTYDVSTGGTYLDRKPTGAPLGAIAVVGTDTEVPRAYELRFTFAKDVLTPESNIGKALIAKYGAPDSSTEPIRMRWNAPSINDLYLSAECGGTEGPTGNFCIVQAYDGPLLDSERSIKQAADAAKLEKSGPPAPKL